MENKNIRVLLTAANGPGAMGIIHALKSHPTKKIDIVAGTVDNYENASILLDGISVKIPYVSDENFTEKMLKICKENNINLIVPGFSQESLMLSEHESLFYENNIKILCPPVENIRLCHNKNLMQEYLLSRHSEYVIPCEVARNDEELQKLCIKMGYPNKKICVKPAICNGGSRGFYVLDENYDRYKSYFVEKESRVCTLEELMLKLKGIKEMPPILVMKYIEGQEYGIDVVAKEGNVVAKVIRKRLLPQMAGIDMRVSVEESEELSELTTMIVKELNLSSLINIDIMYETETNKPYVLEINPRQSAYIGASAQKINLLAMAIDMKFNEEIILERYMTSYTNVMGIRYIEEFCICDGNIVLYKK